MKNIHVLPTEKPSRLYLTTHEYIFEEGYSLPTDECENKNIYITSNEEIKEGDWFTDDNNSLKRSYKLSHVQFANPKKIILTTDQDLIKNGVQAIDDEFLEWFVKNPSCEFVEVKCYSKFNDGDFSDYKIFEEKLKHINKIIIPKEEPKQETLEEKLYKIVSKEPSKFWEESDERFRLKETVEEVAEIEFPLVDTEWCRTGAAEEENLHLLGHRKSFIKGAKWQQEQDKNKYSEEDLLSAFEAGMMFIGEDKGSFREWFEQFKKR
jgi:hypothetical protein